MLGAVAVAGAIAFGIGGRDIAAHKLNEWTKSIESGEDEKPGSKSENEKLIFAHTTKQVQSHVQILVSYSFSYLKLILNHIQQVVIITNPYIALKSTTRSLITFPPAAGSNIISAPGSTWVTHPFTTFPLNLTIHVVHIPL